MTSKLRALATLATALAVCGASAPVSADEPAPATEPAPADPPRKPKKASRKPRLSGFLQVFYRHTFFTSADGMVDAPNFRVQRVRLAVEGDVRPWLSYDISIDPRAPEVSGVLRDAHVTIKRAIPHHRIRIGQQKTQFGYENNVSSAELWAVNRTEVSDNLSRGLTLRDIGVGLLGRVPLGGGLALEDAVTVVNGNGMNTQIDDRRGMSVWGRLGVRYRTGDVVARLGASGARGAFIDPADPLDPVPMAIPVSFVRAGGDVEVDTPWAFVAAELVWGEDELPTETADELGWYVEVVGKAPRATGPIIRLDVLGDEFQRYTFGAYLGRPDAPWRLLLNYEYRRLKDVVRGDDRLYLWSQVRF